jgi:hypothetical protein
MFFPSGQAEPGRASMTSMRFSAAPQFRPPLELFKIVSKSFDQIKTIQRRELKAPSVWVLDR